LVLLRVSSGGDVRYLGEIDTTEAATRRLVAKLAAKYRQLTFCYEASNRGSSLTTQRSIHSAIHERVVAQQGEAIRTTLYNSDHKFLSRLTDEMHTSTA
jgi:hypothetical protein